MASRNRGVIVRDLGYARILRELAELESTVVEVGIQDDGATSEGVLVSHYGAINEFGGGHVPERSFMRSTFDNTIGQIISVRDRVLDGVFQGKLTAEVGAGLLGEKHQQDIQRTISSHPPPPNAPSTVRRKGSSGTLIDNGTLRASIRWAKKRNGRGSALRVLARRVFRGRV